MIIDIFLVELIICPSKSPATILLVVSARANVIKLISGFVNLFVLDTIGKFFSLK